MEFENRVRQIFREEFSRQSPASNQIYRRTQQLLQDAAVSVSTLPTPPTPPTPPAPSVASATVPIPSNPPATPPTVASAGPVMTGPPPNPWAPPRRSSTNHPYRLPGRGKQTKRYGGRPSQPKTVKLRLLTKDTRNRYRFEPRDILGEGQFTLNPLDSEQVIRAEIVAAFLRDLPLITAESFEFLECERNTVSKPSVSDTFQWDYNAIKTTNRLYIRLVVHETSVLGNRVKMESTVIDVNNTDEEEEEDMLLGISDVYEPASVDIQQSVPTSEDPPINDTVINDLSNEDLQSLVNDLLEQQQQQQQHQHNIFLTLTEALTHLKSKFNPDNERKLRVDEGDELEDTVAFYKSHAFDPNATIIVQFRGQPGADVGGVSRQLFTNLFHKFNTISEWFEGNSCRKLPASNISHVVSGIMKIIGTIFTHSIIVTDGTCGPNFLSPAIFHYLASGDLESSIPFITLDDTTAETRHYLVQVG